MSAGVEILIFMPTHDVPSGRIGNRHVGIFLVQIDRIRNFHWSTKRVIIFQTVILQRVSGVYGLINICGQIDLRLDLWKKVAYNELVQDSHRATEEAL